MYQWEVRFNHESGMYDVIQLVPNRIPSFAGEFETEEEAKKVCDDLNNFKEGA